MRGINDVVDRDTKILGKFFIALRLKIAQVTVDDASCETIGELKIFELNEQTLSQIPRRNADGIKELDAPKHRFDLFCSTFHRVANLLDAQSKISVLVDILDDIEADIRFSFADLGQPQLTNKVFLV